MTGKKKLLCLLLCLQMLVLTGCVGNMPMEKQGDGKTLPDVRSAQEAPIGDSQTAQEYNAVLYVPDDSGLRLETSVQRVAVEPGQTKVEAYVAALLAIVDASGFNATRQALRLSPVSNAVETTRDLVTVNMHSSMRFLTLEAQFALRVAIVNTLTELPGINYVNVLVDGRDIGLDLTESIPTGVMERYPGGDISGLWSQQQSQRTSVSGEMQKRVALYFVSEDGSGLLGEVRYVSFDEADPAVYAKAILDELAKGATRITGARTLVPTEEWFERDPVITNTEDGRYIELHFVPSIDDHLALRNSTQAMLFSSICYTLTSFIPGLEGIIVYIGESMVTEMQLMNDKPWTMANGQMTREGMNELAADVCTIYYPLENGMQLYAVSRPIAQRLRTQPRALIRELLKEPAREGLVRALPEGIDEGDIKGLQIQGDTALLNVTKAFAQACEGMTETQERNMIYAIVNTLTEIEGVTRVRFFVEGTQAQLAGYMFMGGEFLRHTGLISTEPLL